MFTDDFRPAPYWWDHAPREDPTPADLPKTVDVLVIGSGYTGLHAALRAARAGRSVLVVEAQAPGHGASSRNGGQISTSVKPGKAALIRKYGAETANGILADGQASREYIEEFVRSEDIACDFKVPGRFHGAHTARQYDKLAAGAGVNDAFMVPRASQHEELGTNAYFGGIVYPHHASLHPGRYHAGLLEKVRAAGVQLVSHCPVEALEPENGVTRVRTRHGSVKAGRVIVATNGYTTGLTPSLQRRVIPIGSYIIATEELPKAVMDRLMPKDRILSDTRSLVYYYRPSPDRKRILFGGRVSLRETDARATAPLLRAELIRLFPELGDVRISHSWSGFVGYTFDSLMHIGQDGGIYYAMGYCGSGVGMASYLGMKLGLMAVDDPAGKTTLAKLPFPGRPYYRGDPWFLAPSIAAYRLRDRLGF
ncbi:NAD(P)/FAD-dependent oxidoreductase [Roseobacter ponti]|uniref:FAD-binding oxidoreductase n=1 Tax=Roseobacter ponti TaxID=1891787 RepID=A0A858SQK8_9RHOB|nr:FAD-binding oxidoreductase [Roseobacter ponti]QJF51129.1 FAD-binding oxidoreductase [Roseobacter ponti]